ncbi:hypothetical protein FCV25MIE_30147 [Fagus crenata]
MGFSSRKGGSCGWIGMGWNGCDGYLGCGMVGGKACAENMDGSGWSHGVGSIFFTESLLLPLVSRSPPLSHFSLLPSQPLCHRLIPLVISHNHAQPPHKSSIKPSLSQYKWPHNPVVNQEKKLREPQIEVFGSNHGQALHLGPTVAVLTLLCLTKPRYLSSSVQI